MLLTSRKLPGFGVSFFLESDDRQLNIESGYPHLAEHLSAVAAANAGTAIDAAVSDLRGATEPVLKFLGCAWTDEVEDFRRTAEARGRIQTPSYSQVSQELYQTAAGRWKNYQEQMAPVMGLLEPWIEHWGYGDAKNMH